MASKVTTLFEDSAKTNALYPRTKVSAVSDNNGKALSQIIDEINPTITEDTLFNISGLQFHIVKDS